MARHIMCVHSPGTVLDGFHLPQASTALCAQLSALPHQESCEDHSPTLYFISWRLFQALMTSDTAVQEEGTLPTASSQPEYLAAPNAAPAAGPAGIIEIIEAIPVPTPSIGPILEISAAPTSGPASGPAAGPIEGILIGPGIIIAPSTGPAAGPLEGILFNSEIPVPNLANAEAAPDEPADYNIPDTPNPAGQSGKVQDPTTTDQPVPMNPSAGTGNGDDDSLRH